MRSKKVDLKKLSFVFLFNLIVFILFICFTDFHYDVADSAYFSKYIAEGDWQIHFTNYFLCAFCGLIQKLIYPISAFSVVEIALCFWAFCMITAVFTDRFGYKYSTLIMIFLYGFFGINHYATVSFTLAPGLLCAAGFLSLIHYLNSNKSITGIICGLILLLFASMYRFGVFEVSLLVAAVFYVVWKLNCFYAENKDKQEHKFINAIKSIFTPKFILIFAILLVSTFAQDFVSDYINTSTEELSYYAEYTNARSKVYDYEIPEYEQAKESYDAVGISENDLKMAKKLYMDDEGAFALEKLQQIGALSDVYLSKSYLSIAKDMFWIEACDAILAVTDKGMLIWAFGIVTVIFLIIMQKRKYVVPITMICCTVFLYYFFYINGRCVYRVVYEIVLCSIIFIIYSVRRADLRPWFDNLSKKKYFYAAAAVFTACLTALIVPCSFMSNWHMEDTSKEVDGYSEMLDYVKENPDKKFEFSKGSIVKETDNNNNPLIIEVPEYLPNTITFEGTYYRDPNSNRKTKEFVTDNLYSYLIDNEDVYFVDNNQVGDYQIFETYLNEHYSDGSRIALQLYKSIGDYNIYSVVTE